ncbi:MAG: 4-hydroxythreonine-4-phosphate dehydrogenase PdxA [Deltaproteobacteria bacterium]|nr:4-hydroxythreonine-4-phosphate dehydrogenase PdxA [Deltaproteobacteria bacterium]
MISEKKPTGVVIGDAVGIGPEITVKALMDPSVYRACSPVLIGDLEIVRRAVKKAGSNFQVSTVTSPREADVRYPKLNVISVSYPELTSLPMGKATPESGKAFVSWFQKAYELAKAGELGAVVYAPLNKEAVYAAGYPYHDELDIIKDFDKGDPFLLVVSIAGQYRFASIPPLHVSLRKACEALNRESVFRSLLLLDEGIKQIGIMKPVIGVSGLNPHAGESGLHGDEEIRIIGPAIKLARREGVDARGPYPPDTVFVKAKNREFDAVLGMYHDQTRIAIKLLKFKKIIYTTLGIPTHFFSVAHGTAYDIAGKGVADPGNFKLALRYAGRVR